MRGEDHACLVNRAHCLGQTRHGAQADYVMITERMALASRRPHLRGRLVLSCAGGTAYSALRKVTDQYADTIVVFGLGPVGLMAVMFGRAMGARVIGIDLIPERLELGKALGAEAVIDASHEDPSRECVG